MQTSNKTNEHPVDDQLLRSKYVGAVKLTNKNIVRQVGVKYYVHNIVARKVYNIKFELTSFTYCMTTN
jgi:hypothetical protein